jgi:methionyl-tRNA formyltransferase
LRTAFLGTSDFAAGVLDALAGSSHRPSLVVTRPDKPRGRGRRTASPPVAERARELDLAVYQPASVNTDEALAELDRVAAEAVVICAFGALIKEPLLSRHPMLNVHPSLLPRWRGAAPVERAIAAGDEQTGVCVMRLTAGLDSGPVCASTSEPIAADDDYGTLSQRLCALGGRLIVATLDAAAAGQPLPFEEQDEQGATYAEKITAEDRLLSPERPAAELARTVRALRPHIGANLLREDGSKLGVRDAVALTPQEAQGIALPIGKLALPAGKLASVQGRLLLGTSGGVLELLSVQPPGGKAMDAASYLRGHAL